MDGYIKLYRKVLDNPVVCKDAEHLAVWLYLLLNATHKECDVLFKKERITLKPGQLITGRRAIAVKLSISEYKVQRILKFLENEHQIAQRTTSQNRLITIANWNKYQEERQQDAQQVHNECTTNAQRVHTNKNDKNVKNDKNEKNINKQKKTIEDVFRENNFSKEFEDTLRDFIEMRKAIKKPMTAKALELLLKNLDGLTNLEADKEKILNQSIEHCWQSVYPLKNNQISSNSNKYDYKGDDTL